jgi:hypothetical protein
MFVGLYVQQVCLCFFFLLVQDETKTHSATPEGALMIVLIVFTVSIIQSPVFDDSHARPRHSFTIPSAILTALSSRPYPLVSLIVLTTG